MITYLPIPGGHITLAERFVNSSFSFALGWNYWYHNCVTWFCGQLTFHIPFRCHYIIVVPTELNGASILINFWDPHQKITDSAVWITIGIAIVIGINLMGAGERFHLIRNCVSGLSLNPTTQAFMEKLNLFLRKFWFFILYDPHLTLNT